MTAIKYGEALRRLGETRGRGRMYLSQRSHHPTDTLQEAVPQPLLLEVVVTHKACTATTPKDSLLLSPTFALPTLIGLNTHCSLEPRTHMMGEPAIPSMEMSEWYSIFLKRERLMLRRMVSMFSFVV